MLKLFSSIFIFLLTLVTDYANLSPVINKTTNQNMKKEQRLTKLHDLPEFEFETGTALDNVIKSVGDDRTPRQLINDWNAWSMTVQDFVSQVRAGGKTVSES